jgi:arginyl-tRNA--protein-N-Asp/Glu arginylyltransferase
MPYLNWKTQIMKDGGDSAIHDLYEKGYLATRVDKGVFNQTRSLRLNLSKFELSSENRRILRKVENLEIIPFSLPYKDYHWSIHKLAKDFYTTKFGEDTFSANKIKELLTEKDKSNFNTLLVYKDRESNEVIGYCIALMTENILHYSYPFYRQSDTQSAKNPSLGLGMMELAIIYAKEKGMQYIYLGSLQRPSDTYKLQFSGFEWFNGENWQTNIDELKTILK